MFATYNIGSAHYDLERSFLIDGAGADIVRGQLVMEGAAVDSLGAIITATASAANVVGLLTQLHDQSVAGDWTYDGTLSTKTNRPMAEVDIRPFAIFRAEIKVTATQTFAAANNGADTNITLGTAVGGADILGGSWVRDGNTGDIRFVYDNSGTNDLELSTATSADWNAISGYWCPQRLYGSLANQGLTPSAGEIICEGNETTLWAKTVDNFIWRDEMPRYTRLNPGLHDAISATNGKFFVDILILDHAFNNL